MPKEIVVEEYIVEKKINPIIEKTKIELLYVID